MHFIWNAARAEPGSLGIVESIAAQHLSLRALSTIDLVCRVFEAVGIEATPSRSGRVATTLIRQMGGLNGCRVFTRRRRDVQGRARNPGGAPYQR
jgi:hypothetical protein